MTLLRASPRGSWVILFGSFASGRPRHDSDLDFLVVQPSVPSRRREMVRLRAMLRPLGLPADVLVVDRPGFEAWKMLPNNVVNEAWTRGIQYGPATDEPVSGVPCQGA
ncbi:MAG: nucleotidyltransferase domain-containing protein [Phycisphaerae bacterium]